MERVKQFIANHFEMLLVGILIMSIVIIHQWVPRKDAFLSFYYLPVLLAGYYLGKRQAATTAILSILVVVVLAVVRPQTFQIDKSLPNAALDLTAWGGFLLLAAVFIGLLFEQKQKQLIELRTAYVGIVEILSKYLESADRYTQGHSIRVANLATDIAVMMDLPREEVENIRTAALLHDIGKVEVSGQLIRKAAELTTEEKSKVATHTRKGAELLMSVGSVLKDAVPLVLHHHTYYGQPSGEGSAARADVPLGAHIIGVADAYDAIITDRAYRKGRTPREALEEIERSTPRQFHPDVVGALRRVMLNLREEKEALVWAPTAPARASSSS